jgi:hypothetical protein
MAKVSHLFDRAIEGFDALNAEDPNTEPSADGAMAKELLYARRMSDRLAQFEPNAEEAVQLAVRAQHICRWKIPRDDYPMTREGYREWRKDLGAFHAETAGAVMREHGYAEALIADVSSILKKERLKTNPSAQILEDVACLVFLEHYLDDFVRKHDEQKIVNIVRRTWGKMSEPAHQVALALELPDHLSLVVGKALAPEGE